MAIERTIRWAPWSGPGLEHAHVEPSVDGGIVIDSVVTGEFDGVPFGLDYHIRLRSDWTFHWLRISPVGGWPVSIFRRDGIWTDHIADGTPELPMLAACTEVDLRFTPITNTLPIRRLGLAEGQSETIAVAYIEPPHYRPVAMSQRYTCVEQGRRYRYEDVDGGFDAELEVDADGFVLDYPGLFRRV